MKTSAFMTMAISAVGFVGVNGQVSGKIRGEQWPVGKPVLNELKGQGCWKSIGNMTEIYSGTSTTSGYCWNECKKKYSVLALQGSTCYCGQLYPEEGDQVDDDKCDWECPGWPFEACGALKKYYSVFNTGKELAPDNYVEEKSTTSAAASSTDAAASTATGGDSSAATQTDAAASSEAASDDDKKDGPNVAAIAAGVVVGVVLVAAIGGGAIFFVRRRRNAEIEEEHRRNAAVNAFINGSKPPGSSGSISMTDSRLDPVMAHRRLSDGSIADNQDYSRRILRVTNA
ncbi:cell wall integrity and stress response component 1 [Fusarium longipes]|uniref:Cell wall integrity and stress response component 1 n=1 Tax=Fusarium longipes TaxID=694270 RepID=A0A395RIH9_9HYPO|nr:cell wall integrity and stress response component 1 [Fusarium longipes]